MDTKQAQHQLQKAIRDSGMSRKRWYRRVYLKSDHWKTLKKALFFKRGKHCERCDSCLKIDVHHKEYRFIYDVTLDDLEILCRKCHQKEHRKIKKKKKKEPRKPRQYRNPKRILNNLIKEVRKEMQREMETDIMVRMMLSNTN